MLTRLLCLAAAALAFASAPAAGKLSPAEQKMLQTIDSEQGRTVAMLGRWVGQNSGTMNFAGVRAVGETSGHEAEHALNRVVKRRRAVESQSHLERSCSP